MNDDALQELGVPDKIDNQVLRLARLGIENGIGGIVTSPNEIKMLRAQFGSKVMLVVPGIRPSWSQAGDQKRAMTPRDAFEAGADYLVIGRPITAHANPSKAVENILAEIRG
jgi:orotidine-5'-phosphate decarboxylase